MKSNARSTGAQGKPWFQWVTASIRARGSALHPAFRVQVADGQPKAIEMFVQLRKADGTADVPKTTTIPWPSWSQRPPAARAPWVAPLITLDRTSASGSCPPRDLSESKSAGDTGVIRRLEADFIQELIAIEWERK